MVGWQALVLVFGAEFCLILEVFNGISSASEEVSISVIEELKGKMCMRITKFCTIATLQ